MRFKRLWGWFFLIFIFLVFFLILNYQDQLKEFISFNQQRVQVYLDNFFYQSSPQATRRAPLSTLQQETELKLYIGEPFKSFSVGEWESFWKLIFGAFPKERPKPGLPRKVRQLTLEEIEDILIKAYPEPFDYFKDEHWKMFFGIILKRQ